MVKEWVMNEDDFDRFLRWLDPDREEAGKKYEKIRRWLIRLSRARGKSEARAEEIADDVIDRVARKLPEVIDTYEGPREPYFYGFWRKVILEPDPRPPVPPPSLDDPNVKEWDDQCLQHCLKRFAPEDRRLLLEYYSKEGREKIEWRRQLAAELGISENALRIRLSRLRATLKACMDDCLKQDSE